MVTRPIDPARLKEFHKIYLECGGNASLAATKFGISKSTGRQWAQGIREGLLNTQAEEVGFPAEQVSSYWVKTKEGSYHVKRPIQVDVIEAIKEHFEDYAPKPVKLAAVPKTTDTDTLTLYPLSDLHLGLLSWGKETGTDWDLPTALAAYREAMQRVSAASPASERAIVLGGGDLLHSDDYTNATPAHRHPLDVDSRFPKILKSAIDLLVFQIDLARSKHSSVTVRILPGNHDITAAIAVTYALDAWYRNEPRVTVDTDPGLFWFYPFERTLLGATHGHQAKVTELPLIMANRCPEWSSAKHRYGHCFHVHHRSKHVFEGGGVQVETHQSPVAQDAHHFGKGYISGRSMQSITYHRQHGEIARCTVALV